MKMIGCRPLVLAGCLSIALAPAAFAAGDQTGKGSAGAPKAAQTGATTQSATDPFKNMQAADMIGKTIYDQEGNAVGRIDAVIVKGDHQMYPVVSVGQYLAVGERRVMLPASHFDASDPSKITLKMTKTQLETQQEMRDSNV